MKTHLLSVCICSLSLLIALSTVSAETPAGTVFTYQGQLEKDGVLVTDECEFTFSLWDDPVAVGPANQVGPTLTFDGVNDNPPPVEVTDGLFTAKLDFGVVAFSGDAHWLDLGVKCPGDKVLTRLNPRQPITGTPYALQTRGTFVDEMGNLGVGTATPAAKLDVAGDIKVSNSAANCDGTREGSLRYNSTAKDMEYCNGNTWNEIGGGGVPPGTIIFFDPTPCSSCSCPEEWTEVTAARGRYLVGVPGGGTIAGVQGTPLTDLEARSHGHTVDVWASDLSGTILAYENPPGQEHTVITTLGPESSNKWMSWHGTLTYASHNMKGKRETTTSVDDTSPYLQLLVCKKD